MATERIIVIGGSAGVIEGLVALHKALTAPLPAPVVVVVHLSAEHPSALAQLIGRADHMAALPVTDGMEMEPGHIYVAVPDHHLLVEDGHLRLSHGPRHNRSRPAIDPLFQSAAGTFGEQAIGVLLSGTLDDGTAGLAAIKAAGGTTIVQSPEEAAFKGMIESALVNVAIDHVLPVAAIARLLKDLVKPGPGAETGKALAPAGGASEAQVETHSSKSQAPSAFTCPDCGGSLWERNISRSLDYVCRVGHSFSPENLLEAKDESLETALWIALRSLEERADLARRMTERAEQRGQAQLVQRYRSREEEVRRSYDVLQKLITPRTEADT